MTTKIGFKSKSAARQGEKSDQRTFNVVDNTKSLKWHYLSICIIHSKHVAKILFFRWKGEGSTKNFILPTQNHTIIIHPFIVISNFYTQTFRLSTQYHIYCKCEY